VPVAVSAPAGQADEPEAAGCGEVEHFWPPKLRRPGPPPLAIGDSVMLGAVEELQRAGFELDVRGCRQMGEGLDVLSARRATNSLPDVVVIALGTNWTVSTSEIRSAMRIIGPYRVLGMVTPPEAGGGASSDHTVIRAAGRRWPTRVKLLDWVAYSTGQSWTWDGMHLKPQGAAAFARLLSRAFTWPVPGLEMTAERVESAEPAERLSAPSGRRARP
jgi:hypothetical protein